MAKDTSHRIIYTQTQL